MIEIANRSCVAVVAEQGAELKSLRVGDDEVIWPSDPAVWSGSAPVLFPVVGRLSGGGYTHGGQRYELAKHGFVRTRDIPVEERTLDRVTFLLEADDETRASYPFEFALRITFGVTHNGLAVTYAVHNPGDSPLLFSLGSHPALRLPLERAKLEECYLELAEPETLGRYRIVDGLLSDEAEPFLDNTQELALTPTLFDDDALIFKDLRSDAVTLRCRGSKRAVRVDLGGAPDLGVWAKPGADYVCVEPWFGHDDPVDVTGELADKPGIINLESGRTFETTVGLSLTPG